MKNEIKFAHNFVKLCGQKKATLLAVNDIPVKMLSPEFIEIDIIYHAPGGAYENYALPKGNVSVLVLTFLGEKLIPFSACRSWGTAKKNEIPFTDRTNL